MIGVGKEAAIYEGIVTHSRLKPVRHELRYRVFSFLLDLDRLTETADRLRFFSRGKFNLFSFHDRDHGAGSPENLAAYIRTSLRAAGLNADGRIMLHCYPRMLGYAFNPLAVYYCYDAADRLSAMIYEVNNTFGDRHAYLIPVEGAQPQIKQSAQKEFHVSPFMEMDMRYDFALTYPEEKLSMSIKTSDREGAVLNAVFKGKRAPLTDETLRSLFFRYPLMTLKVIFGIHWEALKLILKGMRLRPGAPAPEFPMTLVGNKLPDFTPEMTNAARQAGSC